MRHVLVPIGQGEVAAVPLLLRRIAEINGIYNCDVNHREYESWFLSSINSLGDLLRSETVPPNDPERVRRAKEWLSRNMPAPYNPIRHQASFTKRMDLEQVTQNRSFARIRQKLEHWFASIQ